MRVGVFRRIGSYLIDAIPVFLIVTTLLSWFIGDIIKNNIENYTEYQVLYAEALEGYNTTSEQNRTDLDNNIISEDEFNELQISLQTTFLEDNQEYIEVVVYQYWTTVLLYIIISFNVIYFVYMLLLKGNTYGRKFMHIELVGHVKWYTLLLREIIWKHLFWAFTFSLGIFIDILLIGLSSKKKALRDILTQTQIANEGTQYPF